MYVGSKSSRRRRHLARSSALLNEIQSPKKISKQVEPLSDPVTLSVNEDLNSSLSDNVSIFSDTESESETSDSELDGQFVDDIVKWALRYNVTHVALRSLLKILKQKLPGENLPTDPRTLLSTRGYKELSVIGSGKFHYFGIAKNVQNRLGAGNNVLFRKVGSFCEYDPLEVITITVGIDGLPVSRSSKAQLWPTIGYVDQCIKKVPFLISAYFGYEKPSIKEYLLPFVNEMNNLEEAGIVWNGKKFVFRIRCIVADAPARNLIKCTSAFNGYNGCDRCVQKGKWTGRVIFPKTNCPPRTDDGFRLQIDPSHHGSASPLQSLKIGLVSQVVLDYMHLCCLGVTRKLIYTFLRGRIPYRLSSSNVKNISSCLETFKSFIPREFARKGRTLRDFDNFKATELRLLMLYTGPAAFKSTLEEQNYRHFLLFSASMYVLLSPKANDEKWLKVVSSNLRRFVELVPSLYGEDFLSYNVHSLIHIADDAKAFGPLDLCSAFPFENYMQRLKRMLRGKNNYLEQLVNRVFEYENNYCDVAPEQLCLNKDVRCALAPNGDNCYLLVSGQMVLIEKFDSVCNNYHCRVINKLTDVKEYPFSSSLLGISYVEIVNSCIRIKAHDISRKLILLPTDQNKYFCIPMLHDNNSSEFF